MLDAIGGGLGRIGASIAGSIVALIPVVGAIALGVWIAKRRAGREWAGIAGGILAFILLSLMFWPSVDVLRRKACVGLSEYEECVSGGGDGDWGR